MTGPRRLRCRALLAPAIAVAVGLAPLVAAGTSIAPATSAGAATTNPIQITLRSLRPIAPQPGDTLVVAGTLTNVSDVPVTGLYYELKIGTSAIGSRGAFDSYAGATDQPLPIDMAAASPAIAAGETSLSPDSSEPFRITVPVASLDLPSTLWQVRELAVSVTDEDLTVVGTLRTFLPWAPRDAPGNGLPTRVAWLWPLSDRPHRDGAGTWYDDNLAPELAAGGRLSNLLAAGLAAEQQRPARRHAHTADVPVTWAIDPMLAGEIRAMTAGYRVTAPSGSTTAGTGTTSAKNWLGQLRTALGQSGVDVLPLPYADPDVVAAVRAGFSTAIGVATATGRTLLQQVLGPVSMLRYGWPPGGFADQRSVDALLAAGDTTVVLSDEALPVVGGPPAATPNAHTTLTTSIGTVDTLLTDSVLSSDVDAGADNPALARTALQRYLAETLMIQAELPFDQRDVVVAPDQRWDPTASYADALLADTGKVPWIQPVSLSTVDASAPTTSVQRGPLRYPVGARRNELPGPYLQRLSGLRNEIADFSAILPQGDSAIRGYTTDEQQALSAAWRGQPALASDVLGRVQSTVHAAMSQVHIASLGGSFVTLTSHGGKVPVTIANDLGEPVQVTVQLEANQRLSLAGRGRVAVPIAAHQVKVVDVHAAAKTSGVFPLEVQLLTPKGHTYGKPVELFVRSTVYGTIALAITGAATGALLIAVAVRLVRRARAARRSSTAPAAG